MNIVILLCLVILLIIMIIMIFSRSQALQRMGVIGVVLIAAIGGVSFYGYQQASGFAEKQYKKLYTVSLGGVYSYMQQLESNEEIYSYNSADVMEEVSTVVSDALPVVQNEQIPDGYMDLTLVHKDETGAYYECYHDGQDTSFWNDIQTDATGLIEASVNGRSVECGRTEDEDFLFAVTDKTRIAPSYAVVIRISGEPLDTEISKLQGRYFRLSLSFMAAGMLLTLIVVVLQEHEIRRMVRLVSRVAEGKKEWGSLKTEQLTLGRKSTEMRTLQNSLWQIASNIEWMNYSKYRILQAYYRFAPKQIERILHKETILDVEPLDRVTTEASLAFVSFAEKEGMTEREYLRQMVKNYAHLGDVRKEYDGIIISGNSDLSAVKLMFNEEIGKAIGFGIKLATKELTDESAGDAFILLHRTQFVYGVAGDEEQAFTYVHSNDMKILDRYVDAIRNIGVRMAVTDHVYDVIGDDIATRYIGYIENPEYSFKIYEILDAYPADERRKRLELRSRFQKALGLFYKSDFYLARNMFSEILRSCPTDEVAKWYLFLCENSLNDEDLDNRSYALFPQK